MASPTGNPKDHVQLNLIENGLDFLLSAAESVQRDENPRNLKDAVLHVANGTELLFKARLAGEHWSLIFSNPGDASLEKLAGEEFHSVDLEKAVDRLDKIARAQVDKATITHLKNLRKFRNKLTHFTAGLDPTQTKSLVAKSMALCIEFCEEQGMITQESESKLGEIHKNLTELQEFVDERTDTISEEWKDALVWECPECWQETLVIDGGEVHCKFCRQTADPRELAASNSEGEVEDCPECGESQTFANVLDANNIIGWTCFSCGQGGQNYAHCSTCDQMEYFSENDSLKICQNCWSNLIGRE